MSQMTQKSGIQGALSLGGNFNQNDSRYWISIVNTLALLSISIEVIKRGHLEESSGCSEIVMEKPELTNACVQSPEQSFFGDKFSLPLVDCQTQQICFSGIYLLTYDILEV